MTSKEMVAMEGVCLAFMLVVMSAYIVLPRSKGLKKDWFFYSLVFTILGVVFDIISWGSELSPTPAFVQYGGNFLALIMTNLVVSSFAYYIVEMINEKRYLSVRYAHCITAVNIAAILVTAIGAACGKLYEIIPDSPVPGINVYNSGGFFYETPMFIGVISLAFLFALVLRNSRVLGTQKIIVFSIYFMLPLVVGILELVVENLLLSYIAISVSISIVYAMLQSNHINELMLRDKLLNEVSNLDQLTGLLNRRAYERDIDLIKEEDSINIVFCDLNGLKQVNDEQGHGAGDMLLIMFADILTKYFPRDSVYRISGDEFVVILRNAPLSEYERNITRLKEEVEENGGIAACGTAAGTGDSVQLLINKAEVDMYADKNSFYRRNPENKRGKGAYVEAY